MSLERPKCCRQEAEQGSPGGNRRYVNWPLGLGSIMSRTLQGKGAELSYSSMAGRLWGRESDDPAQGTEPITLPRAQRLICFPPCREVLGSEDSKHTASEHRALRY